jgi:cytochrome c553
MREAGVLLVVATLVVMAGAVAGAADLEAGRRKAEPCGACHGPDGNASIPGMPSLAGQPVFYTHWQLIKFRDGRRKAPEMAPFVTSLTDADLADLAAFYEAQAPRPRGSAIDPAKAAAGRPLAEQYHCTSCHRPGLTGYQQIPRLAGQDLAYLLRLLRGFKAQTASDLDGTMTMAAQPLTDAAIESLAHYIAGLPSTEIFGTSLPPPQPPSPTHRGEGGAGDPDSVTRSEP